MVMTYLVLAWSFLVVTNVAISLSALVVEMLIEIIGPSADDVVTRIGIVVILAYQMYPGTAVAIAIIALHASRWLSGS